MDCSMPGFPVHHQLLKLTQTLVHWVDDTSISLSSEYSGLISFRIDWFDLLAVQGTLMSLPQHHSLKASILWLSAFFKVQLSHPFMTTGKNHSFDYSGLYQQSDVSAFWYIVYVCHSFSSKEQMSFNFMAAVTICSNFGAQELKPISASMFLLLFAMKWWYWMPWS